MTATLCALAMLGALLIYALFGGADFGGGVWDLLATGPRREAQRALIERAITPVWEANHVWLIIMVVILFTAFPAAFAAACIALHVPLSLLLLGVVLRGTAFTFRHYDQERVHASWGRVFAIASTITPLLLGMVIGAITSGRLRYVGEVPKEGFFHPWLAPFPALVGLLTLALFALLAAVYLTVETDDPHLVEDFRSRALAAAVAVDLLAVAAALLSRSAAIGFAGRLFNSTWSWPLLAGGCLVAAGVIATLLLRRFRLARLLAAGQAVLVLLGWALAQRPYLIAPEVTIASAAAPERTLRLLLATLAAGALILVPSLLYLMAVFKSHRDAVPLDDEK